MFKKFTRFKRKESSSNSFSFSFYDFYTNLFLILAVMSSFTLQTNGFPAYWLVSIVCLMLYFFRTLTKPKQEQEEKEEDLSTVKTKKSKEVLENV